MLHAREIENSIKSFDRLDSLIFYEVVYTNIKQLLYNIPLKNRYYFIWYQPAI